MPVPFYLQSTCGISVVRDYYKLQKFNVFELANVKNGEESFAAGDGRVRDKVGDEDAMDLTQTMNGL